MTGSTTRAIVCWWADLRPGTGHDAPESNRIGHGLEVAGGNQPEINQNGFTPGVLPECRDIDRDAGIKIRAYRHEGHEDQLDPIDPAHAPATGSTRIDMMTGACPVCPCRKAVRLLHRHHAVLNRHKRARHSRCHELGQQAEGPVCIGTVIPGNTTPGRGLAAVGAMAGQTAATRARGRDSAQVLHPASHAC